MGRSQRLRLDDIRSVFRLLGEVRELGYSPTLWRDHMLKGLLELVGGTKAHAGEAPISCSPTAPMFRGMVISGVANQRELGIYRNLIGQRDYADDPCLPAMARLISRSFTRTRQQLADNRAWYRRRDLDTWRTLGADCFIYTHQFLPERGCIHLISLNRPWGLPAFNERERRLVALFHRELGRHWRQPCDSSRRGLAPRLRETLDHLLTGASEAEIAHALDLSRHTVHDYVKALYRHYGVRSHARLLARFIHSCSNDIPRLSTDEPWGPVAQAPAALNGPATS